jgi:SAM-dependent methyltransferase
MTLNDEKSTRFWDREVTEQAHQSWLAHPRVRAYVNSSVSGATHLWPVDWFEGWLQGRRFRRGLSIGCGSGGFERDVIGRGLCDEIDAFDGSAESIRIAHDAAREAGWANRIHYSVGNFNEPVLPARTYDVVFAHQSLHHVAKLEKLYRAVLRALEPGGLFYLDEYVGPSREQWTDRSFAGHRSIYQTIPAPHRLAEVLPLPIEPADPSEAIRSDEVLPELRHGFEIVERRDYGGNVLAPLFQYLDPRVGDAVIDTLIERDRQARADQQSFYTVIVARPKSGAAARWAGLRYFLWPKLKRIGREVRRG